MSSRALVAARGVQGLLVYFLVAGVALSSVLLALTHAPGQDPGNPRPVDPLIGGDLFSVGTINVSASPDACGYEYIGAVWGFPVAASRIPRRETAWRSMETLQDLIEVRSTRSRLTHLMLIGRADREPFHDPRYGSNAGLAQARADWVATELRRMDGLADIVRQRTIRLSAGPHHVPICEGGEQPCKEDKRHLDRSVEVFGCWASASPA